MLVLAASNPYAGIEQLLQAASDAYYNGGDFYRVKASILSMLPPAIVKQYGLKVGTPITDRIFDKLVDFLREVYPRSSFLKKVGAPVKNKKLKVQLPIPMPSLDKRKPGNVEEWLDTHKGPYVLSWKLDGSSLEFVYFKGKPVQVFSRGDGAIGGDISFLAPYMDIPQSLPYKAAFRGEGIIPKALFTKHWKDEYDNPRAMANGITNRTTPHAGMEHLDIVIYRQLFPAVKVSDGLKNAEREGFKTVPYAVFKNLDEATLVSSLNKRKTNPHYEIDGLVIAQDIATPIPKSNAKPDHAVAFKNDEEDDVAETKVVEVVWTPRRTGLIFPTVWIEPVRLSGVVVKKASGKSAARIVKLGIGPGAIIKIARSGDVIPDIRGVVKKVKPQMPDIPYQWDGDNVWVKGNAEDHSTIVVGRILHFFAALGVEKFKSATIQKFVDAGYDTVAKILALSPKQFVGMPGTSVTMYQVLEQMDDAVENVPLPLLMYASGIFGSGFGSKRADAIVKAIPNVMKYADMDELYYEILNLQGFDESTAEKFVRGLPKFKAWLKTVPRVTWVVPKQIKGALTGQSVLFTGFRSKDLEATIKAKGGDIASSIGKATVLVTNDPNSTSAKAEGARQKGIPIMTPAQFMRKFNL